MNPAGHALKFTVPLGIQTERPHRQEFDEAAQWLLERADADDVIVVGHARPESLHTYYRRATRAG